MNAPATITPPVTLAQVDSYFDRLGDADAIRALDHILDRLARRMDVVPLHEGLQTVARLLALDIADAGDDPDQLADAIYPQGRILSLEHRERRERYLAHVDQGARKFAREAGRAGL